MIQIYTTPSCSSCRKAKKWFDDHRIEYREKNIFNIRLTRDDIMLMLKNTEAGFDDMTMSELTHFIIENPSVLRRPIIVEDRKMQVGYNEDEIRTFIPKRLREIIMCTTCDKGADCDYMHALNIYFKELRDKEQKRPHTS